MISERPFGIRKKPVSIDDFILSQCAFAAVHTNPSFTAIKDNKSVPTKEITNLVSEIISSSVNLTCNITVEGIVNSKGMKYDIVSYVNTPGITYDGKYGIEIWRRRVVNN